MTSTGRGQALHVGTGPAADTNTASVIGLQLGYAVPVPGIAHPIAIPAPPRWWTPYRARGLSELTAWWPGGRSTPEPIPR